MTPSGTPSSDPTAEKEQIRRRFLAIDTSNVADVLDSLGYPNQGLHESLSARSPGKLAGWAYTIRGQMVPYEGTGDPSKMEACQNISAGEVSVWSGNGAGVCYFGELIALGMKERGSSGALVDGGVRDLRWLRQHGFPVYARYQTPVQSIGRWKVSNWQETVYLSGATTTVVAVNPGDFVLGDEDGVIIVPGAVALEVLVEAERLTETEVAIRKELAAGQTLRAVLKKYGHV